MSMQNKLLQASHRMRRKLYDEKIKRSGHENRIIRLTLQEDDFGDYTDITILDSGIIEAEIIGLEKIPINRLRNNLGVPSTTPTTGMYFFDVLPITVRTAWSVGLEKGDILIKKIQDEDDSSTALYLTLQVTETIGTFDTQLINREYNTSFYTEQLTQEVIDLINSY